MKSGLSIISFLFCALGVVSKMHHYIQGHLDFLLLSSRSFRVLHFAFSSVIHFQWFLLKVKACEEDFFFLSVISSHLSTIRLKTFSSPLYWLSSFVKEQVIIFMGIYFWVLQSVSLFCLFFHQHHTVLVTLSVQFSSVAQSCLTLCDPMNCSMPGLPVHHQLPEFIQTHVHWVRDAIQPSHPLLSPPPPAPNPSQHQALFQWVNSSHQVAKVLEFQLHHQSFQWIPRTDLFQD